MTAVYESVMRHYEIHFTIICSVRNKLQGGEIYPSSPMKSNAKSAFSTQNLISFLLFFI